MNRVLYRSIPCCALALFLAGCTPTDQKKAAKNPPPQATAPALPAASAQPAQANQEQAQSTQQQQRVQALIDQVEKTYASGQEAYRKGDLPGAKAEFDRAVDMMLTSGFDIKADPRLQGEFDHIVDAVNSLEMDALKQGNGFVPKEETTPAEAASDVTFAVDRSEEHT